MKNEKYMDELCGAPRTPALCVCLRRLSVLMQLQTCGAQIRHVGAHFFHLAVQPISSAPL